jgi:hypothetical protein
MLRQDYRANEKILQMIYRSTLHQIHPPMEEKEKSIVNAFAREETSMPVATSKLNTLADSLLSPAIFMYCVQVANWF